MDNYSLQAWAPGFKEAAKILSKKDPVYQTVEDVHLSNTKENELWEPDDNIHRFVDNFSEIQVVLINEKYKARVPQETFDKVLKERSAGLILMGPIIDRENKPHLIILATKYVYYAIDPNDAYGIGFIWKLMGEQGFRFYMSNLLQEADCLRHVYKMDLEDPTKVKAEISCATGLHIYMMQVLRYMSEACASKYPYSAWRKSKDPARILSFYELVDIWLRVDSDQLRSDHNQLIHLTQRPLTIAAINMIKKRCCLVSQLNQALDYYTMVEFWWASELTNNTLTLCNYRIANDLTKELSSELIIRDDTSKQEADSNNNATNDRPTPGFAELATHYGNFGAAVSTQNYIATQKLEHLPPLDISPAIPQSDII